MAGWRDLFGGSRKPSPSATDPGGELPAAEGAAALETLGDVLSILGRHAFDIDDATAERRREWFEAWARHVTVQAPAPEGADLPGGDGAAAGEGGGAGSPAAADTPAERSWAGVRHFVRRQRKAEGAYLRRSSGDLRTALWAVVQGLGWTMIEVQAGDDRLRDEIRQFNDKVRDASSDEVVREVWSLVDSLQRIVADRQRRQQEHIGELSSQLRLLRQELDEARKTMDTDALTGLVNRGAFDDQLQRVSALNALSGDEATLVMLDVDHFKFVNDTFGHPAGDEVLRQLGRLLLATFPRRTDLVARYGGEEFVVLFQRDGAGQVVPLVEQLLQRVRALNIEHDGQAIRVTLSAGVAQLRPGEQGEPWLERADRALYRAKEGGRDRVVVDDESVG